jgi:eukaryotic-like serine/threonine-protein kinase
VEPDRNEERWLALAQAVSNGERVDWDHLERRSGDDEENSVVRALHAVEEIARVHKTSVPTMSAAEEGTDRGQSDPRRWRQLHIVECVGQGTFGAVYRAREEGLDREVALKLLWARAGDTLIHPSTVLKEARMLARVRHPNVVTVHGAESAEGRVGLWMEFIQGRTLEDLLAAQGPFGAREATAIGIDLCHALAAVHGAGLLHRDLKCRNVMREEGGRIVLMDFGASAEVAITQPGLHNDLTGTPAYLAPELFEGGGPSETSDVYSLGVLLFHLVSATYPVAGATKDDIRRAHQKRERLRLRDARPNLPDAFVRVVERALAHDPGDRYQTAGAFADDLAAFLGRPQPDEEKRSSGGTWRDHRGVLAAAVILIVAATTAGLWWGLTSEPGGRDAGDAFAPGTVRAGADAVLPDPGSYEIAARFHAMRGERAEPLRFGDRLVPGDQLFMTVQTSKPTYLYVVNQDEQGESYLLFPLPELSAPNPLAAATTHRLPGTPKGVPIFWRVSSAGGREHLFVFASPKRLHEFEQILATLPRPRLDRPVVELTPQAIGKLRGIGGLAKGGERPTPTATIGFPLATPLPEHAELAQGYWARELILENPKR